jgi:urease accessory protein
MSFRGPLRVQRLFYPEEPRRPGEAAPAHCYLLHPPGGLVSGDDLSIMLTVNAGARVLATTPAAGKIYRADSCGVPQRQEVGLRLHDGEIEWLPRETIVFAGARARLSLLVDLRGDSRFLGWDTLVLGRKAGKRPFAAGEVRQTTRLTRNGRPVWSECLAFAANDALATGGFGLSGRNVIMNFWAFGRQSDAEALAAAAGELKKALATTVPGRSGATFRDGALAVRYLGDDAGEAGEVGRLSWSVVRPYLLGRPPSPPRIWNL